MSTKNDKKKQSPTTENAVQPQEGSPSDGFVHEYATLFQLGMTVKLENKSGSYAYKITMICPDNIIICMSMDRPLDDDCQVGAMMSLVRPCNEGSSMIPIKLVSLGDRGEQVAVQPIGKPQNIQRRVFARVRADAGVHIKIQIDNYASRYKSLSVYDVSGGGVGVSIYSKNPLAVGLYCKVEIQLPIVGQNNRLCARGQLAHCSAQRLGGMEYLLGIKFTEISDADQRKIIEYVAQRQQELDMEEEQGRQFAEEAAVAEEQAKKEKAENDPNRIVA